jgi:hypothetical protein
MCQDVLFLPTFKNISLNAFTYTTPLVNLFALEFKGIVALMKYLNLPLFLVVLVMMPSNASED